MSNNYCYRDSWIKWWKEVKQGWKRPLDKTKRMTESREREGEREKERYNERYREGGRDKRERNKA